MCYNFRMEHTYSFSGQRSGEKVVEVIKNHPFVLFFPGLKSVVFLVAGVAIYLLWPSQYSGMVLLIFILIAFAIFFRVFFNYSQSIFLITNQRVINVDQKGFWKRNIIETEHEKITAVSTDTSGFIKTMLKYGDLIIRVSGAGNDQALHIKNIPSPYEIQQKIAGMKN